MTSEIWPETLNRTTGGREVRRQHFLGNLLAGGGGTRVWVGEDIFFASDIGVPSPRMEPSAIEGGVRSRLLVSAWRQGEGDQILVCLLRRPLGHRPSPPHFPGTVVCVYTPSIANYPSAFSVPSLSGTVNFEAFRIVFGIAHRSLIPRSLSFTPLTPATPKNVPRLWRLLATWREMGPGPAGLRLPRLLRRQCRNGGFASSVTWPFKDQFRENTAPL